MKRFLIMMSLVFSSLAIAGVYKEPFTNGMYIVDGDVSFPDLESAKGYLNSSNNKLIVNLKGLKTFDIWNKTMRKKLTYCISDSFKDKKADVIEAFKVATEDWMSVAGVKFIYKSEEDAKCDATNNNVVFDINPVSLGKYLARAFFPSNERAKRNVMIDTSSFRHSFVALSGFLRHELGHVLGFRHEHAAGLLNPACAEGEEFSPVTEYDRLSVMHYPQCGGLNKIENLVLSELDKDGARKIYP